MDDEGDITAGADSSWTAKQREAVAAATADSTNSASQGADELAADVATSLDLDGAQHNTAQAAKAAEREELIKCAEYTSPSAVALLTVLFLVSVSHRDILSAQEGLKGTLSTALCLRSRAS